MFLSRPRPKAPPHSTRSRGHHRRSTSRQPPVQRPPSAPNCKRRSSIVSLPSKRPSSYSLTFRRRIDTGSTLDQYVPVDRVRCRFVARTLARASEPRIPRHTLSSLRSIPIHPESGRIHKDAENTDFRFRMLTSQITEHAMPRRPHPPQNAHLQSTGPPTATLAPIVPGAGEVGPAFEYAERLLRHCGLPSQQLIECYNDCPISEQLYN